MRHNLSLRKLCSLFLAAAMTLSAMTGMVLFYPAEATAAPETTDGRKIQMNDDWRFRLLTPTSITNADSRLLDDSGYAAGEPDGFMSVNLPHDWSIYQDFTNQNGVRDAQGSLPGGTAWYRKTFTTTADLADSNVVVQFDNVQMVSQVYINGTFLGNQHLGYVTFEYDLTPYLLPEGQENVIALKVMSGLNSARWYPGAGIHGSAYLIVTDPVHIPVNGVHIAAVVDENSDGQYVIPDFNNPMYGDKGLIDTLKYDAAVVQIRTEVENKTAAEKTVSVRSTVFDRDGDVASVQKDAVAVGAGGKAVVDQLTRVPNANLWSPADPNLYWVRSEIIEGGEVIDTLESRFGIRYLYLKPGERLDSVDGTDETRIGGFYINGEYTRINAVCDHRDLGALGMEAYQAAIDRRILELKAMGVNAIRSAHNPLSPEYLEACDRLGMLVMEEAFDQWFTQKNGQDYSRWFRRGDDAGYNSQGAVSGTEVMMFNPANLASDYGGGSTGAASTESYVEWLNTEMMPNAVRDIQAMVKRSRNSPSVYLWSSGNEITDSRHTAGLDIYAILAQAISEVDSFGVYSNTLFTAENPGAGDKVSPAAGDPISWRDIIGGQEGSAEGRVRTVRNIAYYPNEAYNTGGAYPQRTEITAEPIIRRARPILCAPPTWANEGPAVTETIKGATASRSGYERSMAWADVGGDNYDTGSYNGRKERNPWMLVGGTENASAFYTRGVYTLADHRLTEGGSRWTTGSYPAEWPFNTNFQSASISLRGHRADTVPFVYGENVWTGHDFLGEPTPESWSAKSSSFGIIDTAGFEKDAFYMYKSAWTDIPTVHLLPQRWNWDAGTQVPVMIYTNAKSVELFINDVSVGVYNYNKETAAPTYIQAGTFSYQPGELKAVAYSEPDAAGTVVATDVARTAGEAQRIELSADRAFIENDGYDLVFVEATIQDGAGVMLPLANNRITWQVEGGEIVALDNGDTRDHDRFRPEGSDNADNPPVRTFARSAFNGKALAVIKADKGGTADLVITAAAQEAEGDRTLSSNTVTVGAREAVGEGYDVYDYEKPEVTTGIGLAPVLPQILRQIMDNGLLKQFSVDAWDLSGVNLNAAGTYTAYGAGVGTTETFEATVHVKAFTAPESVAVTTIAGIAPPLPRTVTVTFDDDTVGAAPVTWDAVNPAQYEAPGSFAVQGKIGESRVITAFITVKALQSIDTVTVYSVLGQTPEMPATVEAAFTDGSKEPLGVVWDMAAADYAYPGITVVNGSVLDSDVTATAVLHVQLAVPASKLVYNAEPAANVVTDAAYNGGALLEKAPMGGPSVEHDNGFGTLATKEGTAVAIDIAGRGFQRFAGSVSLSATGGASLGVVGAKIFVDGIEVFDAENGVPMNGSDTIGARFFDVDVSGAADVRLVTYSKGSGAGWSPADDVADWAGVQFLSTEAAVENVRFDGMNLNLVRVVDGAVPVLPETVIADAALASDAAPAAEGVFRVTWPPVTAEMFEEDGVRTVYGRVEGTANGFAAIKVVTNYRTIRGTAALSAAAVGEYRVLETFDYKASTEDAATPLSDTAAAFSGMARSMFDAWTAVGLENCTGQGYGFDNGIYASAGSANVTFYAPDLKRFSVRNTGNFQAAGTFNPAAETSRLTFAVSEDGVNFVALPESTYTGDDAWSPVSGDWRARTYTTTGDLAVAGLSQIHYLRIQFPETSGGWRLNVNQVYFEGGTPDGAVGGVTDIERFRLGAYEGTVNPAAGTVSFLVPSEMDITQLTPEIALLSRTADYTPKGAQDFTNPVVMTVKDGDKTKDYTVTVYRGHDITYWLNGGTVGGDPADIVRFIQDGAPIPIPAVPERAGYTFLGWGDSQDAAENVVFDENLVATADTTFYARYEKASTMTIYADSDTYLATWQNDKNGVNGGATSILTRNHADYPNFAVDFTNTSTGDSTDLKIGMLQFPTKGLDLGQVTAVTMHVTHYGQSRGTAAAADRQMAYTIQRTSDNWRESTLSWNGRRAEATRVTFYNEGTGTTIESNQFPIGTTVRNQGGPSANSTGSNNTAVSFSGEDMLRFYEDAAAAGQNLSVVLDNTTGNADSEYSILTKEAVVRFYAAYPERAPHLVISFIPKADYQVRYDLNGGTGNTPLQPDLEEGNTFTAADITGIAAPAGTAFLEWNTLPDGTGTGYLPGDIVPVGAGNVTLFAVWETVAPIVNEIIGFDVSDGYVRTATVFVTDPENARLMLAWYDSENRLMAVRSFGTVTVGESVIGIDYELGEAALVRAFLWDNDARPLAEAKEVFAQ